MKIKRMTRPFEVKSVEEDGTFTGYGSVFDVKDSYGDVVVKGAFANTLADWEERGTLPPMLWQHDAREPIGGYTKMKEDDHGLALEGKILTQAGPMERRAYEHLKAKTIRGLSIGYSVSPGGVEYDKEQGTYLLKQVKLWEVSLVTFPANPEAQVDEVKTALEGGPKEFERFLRDAGMSRSQAKRLMTLGYDGLRDLRDADEETELVKRLSNALTR